MTLRNFLTNAAANHPKAVALRYCREKVWHQRTYQELLLEVSRIAEAFGKLGLMPGKEQVAIILDNGPEWIELYLAAAGSGLSVVPLDPKLRQQEVTFILRDSQAVAIFTDTRHLCMLEQIMPDLPDARFIVTVDGDPKPLADIAGRPCHDLATLRSQFQDKPLKWYKEHVPVPHDVASIIYTSGTTGQPKGAMLTHLNFCSDAMGGFAVLGETISSKDDFLIVLPLFHSFSFTANFVIPLAKGCGMFFVESLRSVGDDIKTLRPTVLMAVPLLAEKLFDKIDERLRHNRVAQFLLKLGLGSLIGKKVLKGLGGRLRFMFVGGAPCPHHVLEGFRRIGVPIVEGYGLTECSPVVSATNFNESKVGTIGKKLPNIEVRIADPNEQGVGELQVRGPIVMKGYYNNIEATREAFDGEWLRTGDLASIDVDGYLSIRGRKKALIVNREGKNIYPEEVENMIARAPLIADIVVIGYTVGGVPGERVGAIAAPDMDVIKAARNGQEPEWQEIEEMVRKAIREACDNLAEYKHPRKIHVSREPLERTSVQKIRRCVYQGRLNEP